MTGIKTISDEVYEEGISNLLHIIDELKERVSYLNMEINDELLPEISELKIENLALNNKINILRNSNIASMKRNEWRAITDIRIIVWRIEKMWTEKN